MRVIAPCGPAPRQVGDRKIYLNSRNGVRMVGPFHRGGEEFLIVPDACSPSWTGAPTISDLNSGRCVHLKEAV